MAIPKKGSRIIRIGNDDYAWYIRRKPSYGQATNELSGLSVAIELQAPDAACVLVADLGVSRPDSWLTLHQVSVTPAIIRNIIEKALAAGWEPGKKGIPFRIDYPVVEQAVQEGRQ